MRSKSVVRTRWISFVETCPCDIETFTRMCITGITTETVCGHSIDRDKVAEIASRASMMVPWITILAAVVIFVTNAAPASSGDFEDGLAAYERADYATAFKLWHPLADQGNAAGQSILGSMYLKGQGVPKDRVHAYKWFDIAASTGSEQAGENRAIVAKRMTPDQIAEAQKLARDWKPKQ